MAHHPNTCMFSETTHEFYIKCPYFLHLVHIHNLTANDNQTHRESLQFVHRPEPANNLSESTFSMSYVVYVVLFLSLHACNGRSLGLLTDKSDLIVKDVHKSKLHSTLDTLKLHHLETEDPQAQENHNAEAKVLEITACAISEGKASKATLNGHKNKAIDVAALYSQEASTIEGWRRQALSTLGSAAHDAEEPVDSNKNDIIEDVVVMDYAQPHRKPPIHNTKS